MLRPPSLTPLVPHEHVLPNDNTLYYFPNASLELVKLDFTVEAGSAYQPVKTLAHAANMIFAEATKSHDAQQMAEFVDFRGIVVERMIDVCASNVSFYFLRKYAAELIPLIREIFEEPMVTPQLLDTYRNHRRQQLQTNFQKTSYRARNTFYEMLYTFRHPLGTYALPSDVDLLTPEMVSDYWRQHYRLNMAHIVMAGNIDEELLALADKFLSPKSEGLASPISLTDSVRPASTTQHVVVPSAVQTTIRVGRILPMSWNSEEYAQFMVLNTILGGYFGSRLMSNIREEKGYTYGIYSQTQIHRGSIVFYITADVASESAQDAVNEVFVEICRLRDEQVSEEELELVRNYMMGDFIRSIDGIFEISERYRQMVATNVTEQLSCNLLAAIQSVTPAQLQQLAQRYLTDLITVTAGPEK